MSTYIMRINGLYLEGYDYNNTMGQAGATHGYYIEANDMEAMILTEHREKARPIEGTINLKSQLDRVTDRMRYAGLEVDRLEVLRVDSET